MNNFSTMHPRDMVPALDSLLGKGWVEWDADTVLMSMPEDQDHEAFDKVLAVKSVLQHPHIVLTQAVAFEKVVVAFNNDTVIHDQPQPPEIEALCYAVKQLLDIICTHESKAKDQILFGGEVPGYVAGVAKYRGVLLLPTPLKFAEEMLHYLSGEEAYVELAKKTVKLVAEIESIVSIDGVTPSVEAAITHPGIGPHLRVIAACTLYDPTKTHAPERPEA